MSCVFVISFSSLILTKKKQPYLKNLVHPLEQKVTIAIQVIGLLADCFPVVTYFIISVYFLNHLKIVEYHA